MALSADYGTKKQEHDQRIRPVWKTLIHVGVCIFNNDKKEALHYTRSLNEYITTQRICDGVTGHLEKLLIATGNSEWIPEFMEIVKLRTK